MYRIKPSRTLYYFVYAELKMEKLKNKIFENFEIELLSSNKDYRIIFTDRIIENR